MSERLDLDPLLDALADRLVERLMPHLRKLTIQAASSVPRAAYNFDEAAEALGVSKRMVYRLEDDGLVKVVSIRGRRLVPATEIDRLVSEALEKAS